MPQLRTSRLRSRWRLSSTISDARCWVPLHVLMVTVGRTRGGQPHASTTSGPCKGGAAGGLAELLAQPCALAIVGGRQRDESHGGLRVRYSYRSRSERLRLQIMYLDVRATSAAARILVEAGVSPSPGTVWRALVRHLAVFPGDASVVHLLGHDRASIHVAALHHSVAGARALMLNLLAADPHALVDAFTLRVLQTGHPLRVPILSTDLLNLWVQPEFAAYLESYTITNLLVIPIRTMKRPMGAVRVWRERPDAAYTDDDLCFVESLIDQLASRLEIYKAPSRNAPAAVSTLF